MKDCACTAPHALKKVVLTGGPGAGKSAVLELVRQALCRHVRVVPESASLVFGGGFPRTGGPEVLRAAQRAIFYVQRELETVATDELPAVILCDRGTIDGAAYWPGPGPMWPALDTTLEAQLARYDVVIHLRTPDADGGYDHRNPLRTETAAEAAAIDERIAVVWARHPRRLEVPSSADFLTKATQTLELLRREVPACCRGQDRAAD